MRKINKEVKNNILKKTPWGHSATPHEEGLSEDQIKGLFYRAITDSDNSVISEINRIVEEGNKQFSEIDNTEYFGKLENEKAFDNKQQWIRNGNLVYVYGKITPLTSLQIDTLKDKITNLVYNKCLLMKVTAPEGVVPDNTLSLIIGKNVYTGLENLKSSVEDALNGVYYLRFAIPVNKVRKQTVKIKWNQDLNEETMVFDFNDDYAESAEKKLFIKYASSINGDNMSSVWSSGLKYVGFYYSNQDGGASNYTWARFIPPMFGWMKKDFTVSVWNSNKETSISFSSIKNDSIIIVDPLYSSYDVWYGCKIRLKSQENGTLTLIADTIPDVGVSLRVIVGNRDY